MFPVHSVYLDLASTTGRARVLSELERHHPEKGDEAEAAGISRLYVKALQQTVKALTSGDLRPFDAVTGDHNCHVTASIAVTALQELAGEVSSLKLPKQVNISKKGSSPREIIEANGYAFCVSAKLRYLVEAVILKMGTTCTEHEDGKMTLAIDAHKIADQVKASREIISRMIIPLRESLNRYGVAYIQSLESPYQSYLTRVEGVTNYRGETFQFTCAFYNMKATLDSLSRAGAHFLLVPYRCDQKIEKPLYLFDPTGQPVDPQTVEAKTSILVVEGFGEREAVVERGLFHSIFANIAMVPQYEVKDDGLTEEILALRSQVPVPFRIAHTYATTLGQL